MPKKYTITTPIYYVNSVPHIGTALTTLASDVTSRYEKMRGREVFFVTGTDENGLKVKEAAEQAGREPMPFVDEIAAKFQEIWPGMYIEYDDFIRTTEPRHRKAVERFFTILQEKGHIYKGTYEGWYDVSSETFYKESELVDGKSPDGNEVRWVQEDNYFFRMSAFEQPLLEHIAKNPKFILPESRKNEVVSFIRQGLRDVCISRTNPGWGIPVPGDDSQVIYVWFDALINYVAATGWPEAPDWQEKWPADVQWMGKDILTRFHATLWPAMLLGVGLPLPDCLVGHGWLLMGGSKISKSKGNVVAPLELAQDLSDRAGCSVEVAIDAVRYYMAQIMPFEQDAVFTPEDFDLKYNTDLANDLGNALNRTLAMSHKFIGGVVPDAEIDPQALEASKAARAGFEEAMNDFRVEKATHAAMGLVRFLNKYIDTRAPWALAKAEDPALASVMRSMLLCLRSAEALIRPIMPRTADAIARQLGLPAQADWNAIGEASTLPVGTRLQQPEPIFSRISENSEAANKLLRRGSIDEVLPLSGNLSKRLDIVARKGDDFIIIEVKLDRPRPAEIQQQLERQKQLVEEEMSVSITALLLYIVRTDELFTLDEYLQTIGPIQVRLENNTGTARAHEETPAVDQITIEDFMKVQLRVARIVEATPVEGSDKLMKLQVRIGDEPRQIVAGIRADYEPADLIGRQIVVVYNLKPAKLRGVESQGMLLAATKEDGGAIILQPESEAPEGAKVK